MGRERGSDEKGDGGNEDSYLTVIDLHEGAKYEPLGSVQFWYGHTEPGMRAYEIQ